MCMIIHTLDNFESTSVGYSYVLYRKLAHKHRCMFEYNINKELNYCINNWMQTSTNVWLIMVVVNISVPTLKDPSSAAAMMATPCRVMGLTVPMMMSVLWEHTTVSSCVSTLSGDSGVTVSKATSSTLMEYIV